MQLNDFGVGFIAYDRIFVEGDWSSTGTYRNREKEKAAEATRVLQHRALQAKEAS